MKLISFYAISARDLTNIIKDGTRPGNSDPHKWYTSKNLAPASTLQDPSTYSSSTGIASYGDNCIAKTIIPTMESGEYNIWGYLKNYIVVGARTRINGGSWSAGGTTGNMTFYSWVKVGTHFLKTGDLLEIINDSGGGVTCLSEICILPTNVVRPLHVPSGQEGARTVSSNLALIQDYISSLETGDFISCEYVATSNSIGVFSNLGKATKALIPSASSATPNGTFYFIMTGYDSRGRKKLVADRNVQHGISWDTLNTAGIASGSGLPVVIDGWENMYTMRLLSGGISATDKDNEWDKIIAESTLGGSIAAGDTNVWNWASQYSWSSSSSSSDKRMIRGYFAKDTYVGTDSSNVVHGNDGFRPVLIVEDTTKVTINKVTPLHLYGTQHTGLQLEASASYNGVPQAFKVRVNGVDVDSYGSSTTRNISMDKFIVGNNTVSAVAADGGSASITAILEAPYRLIVNRTFNSYEGGYITDNVVLDGSAKCVPPYTPTIEKTLLGTGAVYEFSIPNSATKVEVK
jgi:hypothetical protein